MTVEVHDFSGTLTAYLSGNRTIPGGGEIRSYHNILCLTVCLVSLAVRPATASDPGTPGLFFNFEGTLGQLTTTLVNPYSGYSIFIDEEMNINNRTYVGGAGQDILNGTLAGDYLNIEDPSGQQVVFDVEVFIGVSGGDILLLASTNYALNDLILLGNDGDEILWGNVGNDFLGGSDGNDILDGGPGNDEILGQKDNDTIIFALGYDTDNIDGGLSFDEIRFAAGIGLSDLTITPTGTDPFLLEYEILVGNGGDKINAIRVERLRFDDGSTLSLILPGGEGDLDGDGFVGINDLNIILGEWNQGVANGDLSQGDPSGDGFVGIDDLNTVLGNWNAGTPPLSGAVPEPSSLGLLALGGAGLLRRRSV